MQEQEVAHTAPMPAPQPTGWAAWVSQHEPLVIGGAFVTVVGGIVAAEVLLGKAERRMGGGYRR